MTLSFRKKIDGNPTYFVEKIWTAFSSGVSGFEIGFNERQEWLKKCAYSFNLDPSLLYHVGIKIHTIREDTKNRWRVGKPIHFVVNNRTPKRFQFAPILRVKSTQQITIKNLFYDRKIWIGGHQLSLDEIETLAKNDGFNTVEDFWDWFSGQDFEGKIIHWTNFIYTFNTQPEREGDKLPF